MTISKAQAAWEKARSSTYRDPNRWRQDPCGAWMRRDQFEHEEGDYGWAVVPDDAAEGAAGAGPAAYHLRNTYVSEGRRRCTVSADHGLAPGVRERPAREPYHPRPRSGPAEPKGDNDERKRR